MPTPLSELREWMSDDESAKALYATLIDASWQDPDFFHLHQVAWGALADLCGIKMEDNGRKVVRNK